MTNQFDFYSIKATSSTIRPLLSAGIARVNIHLEKVGCVTYGRRSFPRYQYTSSVGFAEANGNPDAVAAPWRDKGLTVRIQYHCRD